MKKKPPKQQTIWRPKRPLAGQEARIIALFMRIGEIECRLNYFADINSRFDDVPGPEQEKNLEQIRTFASGLDSFKKAIVSIGTGESEHAFNSMNMAAFAFSNSGCHPYVLPKLVGYLRETFHPRHNLTHAMEKLETAFGMIHAHSLTFLDPDQYPALPKDNPLQYPKQRAWITGHV